ncbi:unnamed protein product [Urochloa humidicola]
MRFSSDEAKNLVAHTQAQLQLEAVAAGGTAVQTEDANETSNDPINMTFTSEMAPMSQTNTLLSEMLSQEPQPTLQSQVQGPLPDNGYILSNQPVARPVPLTTSTKAGRRAASSTRQRKEPTNKGEVQKRKASSSKGEVQKKSRSTGKKGESQNEN